MAEVGVALTLQQLETTFGVLFIGYIVAMIAYGFTFFQTYLYYSRYPMDHWCIRATVAALCLLDTANSVLISHALYHYLVILFPSTTGLDHATSSYCVEFGLSSTAIFIVQIFYAFRVWCAGKSPFITSVTVAISTAAFGLGLTMTSKIIQNPAFDSFSQPLTKSIMASSQGLTSLSALTTLFALCVYLRPNYNPSVKPLEGWYDIFVAYAISRGSLATAIQLCLLITFLKAPDMTTWMPFHLLASKAFVNSFFTMLNSRDVQQGRGVNEEDGAAVAQDSPFSPSSGVRFNAVESKAAIEAKIDARNNTGRKVD